MSERLVNDQVVGQIREAFQNLKKPVEILFFGKKADCEYCADTLMLVQEIVELSTMLTLRVFDLDEDPDLAKQYDVDKAPSLVLLGRQGNGAGTAEMESIDYGVRFAGIPSGYEFSSLIQGLILVSGSNSGLKPETREFLSQLKQPVLLQVFVTPT